MENAFRMDWGALRRVYDRYVHPDKVAVGKAKKFDDDDNGRVRDEPSVCTSWLQFIFGFGVFILFMTILVAGVWEWHHMRLTWNDLAAADAKTFADQKELVDGYCRVETLDAAKKWERMSSATCIAASEFIRGSPTSRIFDAWSAKHLAHFSFMNDYCRDGFCRQLTLHAASFFNWGIVCVVIFLIIVALVTGVAAFKTVINPAKQVHRVMRTKTKADDDRSIPADVREAERRESERVERELERYRQESYTKTTTLPPKPTAPPSRSLPPMIGSSAKQPWQQARSSLPYGLEPERTTV